MLVSAREDNDVEVCALPDDVLMPVVKCTFTEDDDDGDIDDVVCVMLSTLAVLGDRKLVSAPDAENVVAFVTAVDNCCDDVAEVSRRLKHVFFTNSNISRLVKV